MFAIAVIELMLSPAMLLYYSLRQRFAIREPKIERRRKYIYE